ncbi:histidine phosphatase family protein [Carnobacterium sp.]|uniref:histidine phosphatase family protein n=1 Tax=Carnobacterium sp. TaxID=48221 RepID=UPI002FC59776
MKMKKRIFKGFLALSAFVMLAGCGSGANEAKTESKETQVSSAVSSSEKVEAGKVTFYVTRHGKTMFNTVKRAQGWADTPLTDAGVEVAESLGKGLEKNKVKFVSAYSSDAGRARETAKLVLKNSNQAQLELNEDPRLREFGFGIYEGDTDENMWGDVGKKLGYASYEEFMTAFSAGEVDTPTATKTLKELDTTGKAEDHETVKLRMQAALKEIAIETEKSGGGNVLIVAHGMSILAMISDMTENSLPMLENASVTKIIYEDGKYTVESVGDMSYIEAGENK